MPIFPPEICQLSFLRRNVCLLSSLTNVHILNSRESKFSEYGNVWISVNNL